MTTRSELERRVRALRERIKEIATEEREVAATIGATTDHETLRTLADRLVRLRTTRLSLRAVLRETDARWRTRLVKQIA